MQALAFGDTYRDAWLKVAEPRPTAAFSFSGPPRSRSLENDPIVRAVLRRAAEVIEKRGADLIRSYPLVTGVAASRSDWGVGSMTAGIRQFRC